MGQRWRRLESRWKLPEDAEKTQPLLLSLSLSLSLTHTVLKNAFLESFETVSCNRKDIILRVWSHLGYTGVYWVSALGYGRLRETIEWKLVEELERNPEHLKKSSCNIKILPE